jgi:hypothetical protein
MSCAVCEDPKFIFIHIPKTGGTSFMSKRSLGTAGLQKQCHIELHGGHRYLRYMAGNYNLPDYFKFTIVRNPYDRFISLWKTRQLKYGYDLNEFIRLIKARKVPWAALKTQSSWVSNANKVLLIDHFINYENYEKGIKETLKKLGLIMPGLPRLRRTKRNRDYKNYYKTQKQIDFVTKNYMIDLINFGYSY